MGFLSAGQCVISCLLNISFPLYHAYCSMALNCLIHNLHNWSFNESIHCILIYVVALKWFIGTRYTLQSKIRFIGVLQRFLNGTMQWFLGTLQRFYCLAKLIPKDNRNSPLQVYNVFVHTFSRFNASSTHAQSFTSKKGFKTFVFMSAQNVMLFVTEIHLNGISVVQLSTSKHFLYEVPWQTNRPVPNLKPSHWQIWRAKRLR